MLRAAFALLPLALVWGCRFDPGGVPVRSPAAEDVPRLLAFPDGGTADARVIDIAPLVDREPLPEQPPSPDLGPVDYTLPDLPPCGPGTCPGCCQGNVCQAGTTLPLCGAGGTPCEDCAAVGQVCVGNTCQGCATSAQCPGDEVCVKAAPDAPAGSCEPPWGRAWHVQVVSAEINCKKDWEGSTSNPPDAYVAITVGNWVGKSTTKTDNCKPQWNEYTEQVLSKSTKLAFTVWEYDLTNSDDWIGEVSYPSGVPIAVLKAGEIAYQASNTSDGLLKLLVKLWPVP